jgi:hypothetical protein
MEPAVEEMELVVEEGILACKLIRGLFDVEVLLVLVQRLGVLKQEL